MDQTYIKNVTLHCDRIPFDGVGDYPRFFVSRPRRGSWFQKSQQFETLVFYDSGVYPINLETNSLGPPLELWRADEQPYQLSFTADPLGSAIWDPWLDRIIFSCGSPQVLCLNGATNEVTLLIDFAQTAADPAPRTCDFLALDPQHQGRLWVGTSVEDDCDGGGAVYELDLRSSASSSSSSFPAPAPNGAAAAAGPSAPPPPAASLVTRVRRVAELRWHPLCAAAFDAAHRCLLLATSSAIYSLPVDLWQWPDGAIDDDDALEPELLTGADVTGVVGLAADAADGSWYVVENVRVQSVRSRAGLQRSIVGRLELELGAVPARTGDDAAAAAAATADGAGAAGRIGGGGGGSTEGARLTKLVEADRASWTIPHVLPDGRLALGSDGIILMNLCRRPPPPPPASCRLPLEACGHGGGGGGRSLASDLSALLDDCQGPGGGGGDVTLVAAGGVELRAHGAILMARCDYFLPLLGEGGGFGDSGSRRLQLGDVDADVLLCVLRHIYTGGVHLEPLLLPRSPTATRSLPPPPPPYMWPPEQQQQQQVGPESEQRAGGGDPLLALAEVADRLLLPELCHEAQAGVLRRCTAAPGEYLVAGLLWAQSRGFGRLGGELRELYLLQAEALEAAEKKAAAPEPRRRGHGHGHRHGHGHGGGGGDGVSGGGGGPRKLAASNPELAAELELEVAARKRRCRA